MTRTALGHVVLVCGQVESINEASIEQQAYCLLRRPWVLGEAVERKQAREACSCGRVPVSLDQYSHALEILITRHFLVERVHVASKAERDGQVV